MDRYEDPVAVVGRAIRSLRTSFGWSQAELSRRTGISKSMVSRAERGLVGGLSFATTRRLLGAMGARSIVTIDAPVLAGKPHQGDPAHARMSGHVVARLRRAGWETRTEVEVGGDRSRGWIDVLAFQPASRSLLVIELKTEVHDLGQIERSLGWYEREAWASARRFEWRPRALRGCLFLLASSANDARVAENRISFDAGFPLRSRHLAAILAGDPSPDRGGRAIAMLDPASKRRAWCRPLRIDGRWTAAPYADYADFMRKTLSR